MFIKIRGNSIKAEHRDIQIIITDFLVEGIQKKITKNLGVTAKISKKKNVSKIKTEDLNEVRVNH